MGTPPRRTGGSASSDGLVRFGDVGSGRESSPAPTIALRTPERRRPMPRDLVTTLDARFSMDGAAPTSWPEARRVLEEAGTYWVTTVRRDGRPHVTTLQAVWDGDALHFLCGPTEQKTKNLEDNRSCILTTGCNDFDEGLDVVVEGEAVRITDDARLRVLAEAWE